MTDTLPNVLGLDPDSLAWRRVLGTMAHHLQTATLVGNPAPIVKAMRERMKDPQIGDYVVELSTFYRGRGEDGLVEWAHGTGYLRKVAEEPAGKDEDWEEELRAYPTSVRPTDTFYYIQYGPDDDDLCRWSNCSFLVVPLADDAFDIEPAYEAVEGGVVFTRESLLGSLAGAGFTLRDPDD